MNRLFFTTFLFVSVMSLSCKKEVKSVEEIPIKNEWEKLTDMQGYQVSSSASLDDMLVLQTNKSIAQIKPRVHFLENSMKMPFTNSDIRLPITSNISIVPNTFINTSTHQPQYFLRILNNRNSFAFGNSTLNYDLKLADDKLFAVNSPRNHGFSTDFFTNCMALNQNNTLLLNYTRLVAPNNNLVSTFLLLKIETNNASEPFVQVTTKKIVPINLHIHTQILQILAIDDYFLVSTSNGGVLKINEDGTFKKVFNGGLNQISLKINGNIFAAYSHSTFISNNDCETFTKTNTVIHEVLRNNLYNVNDSLISISNGRLITLNWDGNNMIRRELESKLIGHFSVCGVNVIDKNVYITTVRNGIYVKPLSQFFLTAKK